MDTTKKELPGKLMESILGFQTSQALITAVELGLFDAIDAQPGNSTSAHQLASLLNIDTAALMRLLDFCVAVGVLTKSTDGLFQNSPDAKQYLTTSASKSLVGFVGRMKSHYMNMTKLTEAIQKGQAAVVPADIDTIGQVDGEKLEYNDSMARMASPALVSAFDLSHFQSACDLGGGIGGLAAALKEKFPNMFISVMEQAEVVDYAMNKKKHPRKEEEHIKFIKGNIITDKLPENMDLFMISHVCLLLSDQTMMELFGKIYSALPNGGALMLCESLLNDDHTGPLLTSHRDIAELLVTRHGERSASQYRKLLKTAGFSDVQVNIFDTHICYDVIFARKTV